LKYSDKYVSLIKFPISGGIDPDSCEINIEALKEEQTSTGIYIYTLSQRSQLRQVPYRRRN
jgi:hypothetical protein